MKNVKFTTRFAALLICVCAVASMMTSCGKKALTTADFLAQAEQRSMLTSDATEQFSDYDYVKEATVIAPQDKTYKIEFYVLSDASYARSFWESNKAKFLMNKEDATMEENKEKKKYAVYYLVSDGNYMFVEQVDNTVIYANVGAQYMEQVNEFVKSINY